MTDQPQRPNQPNKSDDDQDSQGQSTAQQGFPYVIS